MTRFIIAGNEVSTKFKMTENVQAVPVAKQDNPWLDIEIERVLVTPEIAATWLGLIDPKQRRVGALRVRKMASDMLSGLWKDSFDPVVFDTKGALWNAQHRLNAIVSSGCSIWLLVAKNVPDEMIEKLDSGISRSPSDLLAMEGVIEKDKSPRFTALAKAMMQGNGNRIAGTSQGEITKFCKKYKDVIVWADDLFAKGHKRGAGRAAVVAAIARASFYCTRNDLMPRLERFCEVLVSGVTGPDPSEETIIRLRDILQKNEIKTGANSNITVYRYASRALKAYLHGETLKKLHALDVNYFRLPEDAHDDVD